MAYNTEHRAILDALVRRDAQTAADLMRAHLEQARVDLIGADGP